MAMAFRASPLAALEGVLALLRGLRVRGWNQLSTAAARHPQYYGCWCAFSEPRVTAVWCASRSAAGPTPRIGCVIVGEDEAERQACANMLARALPGASILPRCNTLADVTAAAEEAQCDWLLPIRSCDRLSFDTEAVLRAALADDPPSVIYWDSDQIVAGSRQNPFIKPDWDDVLLRQWDLIGGAALLSLSEAGKALRRCADAQADPDGFMRLSLALLADHHDRPPRHIPLLLSHHHASPFLDLTARTALLAAHGIAAASLQDGDWPNVSIIIPTRDQAQMLNDCIGSLALADYPGQIEMTIIDNDSTEPATLALFDRLVRDHGARITSFPGPFNFAAMMNHAAAEAKGDYLCFLNNDVKALDGAWLRNLVSEAASARVGAAGARLLYPDGAIQHAGVVIGIGGAAGHVEKGVMPDDPWLASWHSATRRVSAVTAACMVVQRSKFLAVGGMDAENFAVDFNDVDLCLKLERDGWTNVVVPAATLVHHESKSRGRTRTATERKRFDRELAELRNRWGTLSYRDPWHSPLFRPESERCLLTF